MKNLIEDLRRSALFFEIVLGLCLLVFMTVVVKPEMLSDIFNAIAMPAWVAVLVSYSPIVWAGIRKPHPTQYERLATGICAGGLFVIASSIAQIYANNFEGQWIYTTAMIPALRFFPMISGISHEMAAQSLDGRVPTKAMIAIGVYCGLGAFGALSLVLFPAWVTLAAILAAAALVIFRAR